MAGRLPDPEHLKENIRGIQAIERKLYALLHKVRPPETDLERKVHEVLVQALSRPATVGDIRRTARRLQDLAREEVERRRGS